jgi:hypothetical protein
MRTVCHDQSPVCNGVLRLSYIYYNTPSIVILSTTPLTTTCDVGRPSTFSPLFIYYFLPSDRFETYHVVHLHFHTYCAFEYRTVKIIDTYFVFPHQGIIWKRTKIIRISTHNFPCLHWWLSTGKFTKSVPRIFSRVYSTCKMSYLKRSYRWFFTLVCYN